MRLGIGVLVFIFWCSSLISLAQTPTAVVNGQVRDISGAAIPNARVEVINDATNVRFTTETNDEGIYSVPNVPPGTYHIRVSKQGFKTIVHPDITLNVQDAKAIGFTLPVGPISDTVTVEGGVPLINTESAAVSTVVDQTYVRNMPLNGRSLQDLILLTPGIVTQSPQLPTNVTAGLGRTGEFNVNGQRTQENYYTVDGVSANAGVAAGTVLGGGPSGSVAAATALGTTQALVSVDDLQEFRVQSSTYSAEYGRNPGGQFAFETKSGTNQWHGTAFDYFRNNYFDANDWFNDYFLKAQPPTRQNDFGGAFGGPLKVPRLYNGKDRTFFFFSYEGLRLIQPQAASINNVPDAALRSAAPAPLNQALNAFPLPSPNGLDSGNGISQFIATWSNPSSLDSSSVRLDHVVNDKLRFFFRFSDTNSDSAARGSGGLAPSVNRVSSYALRTYTAGASSVFSNRLSNDFRLNFSSNDVKSCSVIDAFGGATPVDLVQLAGLSGPTAAITVFLNYGGASIQQVGQASTQNQWNLVDTVNLSSRRHQFKFGGDYRRLAPIIIPLNPSVSYFYLSQGSVQANGTDFVDPFATAPAYPLYTNFSAFAQDEWRVSQRLSLSFGLRWDVNPPPSVTQGLMPYTIQGSGPNTWTLAPQGTPLWQTPWYNFAPRLGAAYVFHNTPGWETVVRGGGGVFFDTGQQLGSLGFQGPGFGADGFSAGGSFSTNAATLVPPIVNPPLLPYGGSVYAFAPHLQVPYALQWNASIEQALGKPQSLTVSYVGSHGAKLLQQNQFRTAVNSTASSFVVVENGLSSDYDSLQIQFRRRLSRGLTVLASYTWSHCVDYGSENYILGYQRGNCDFDVRHNFSAAFSYDLPNVGNNGFANSVLHHWGLDDRFTARTGFPIILNGKMLPQPNGQVYFAGLNLVQGQPIYLYGDNCATVLQGLKDLAPGQGCPGGRAINPQAFTNVSSGFGNAPRNFVRGFGAWQMDMAIRRDFPIREGLKLQFRAEAFNIFNHPNFGNINSSFGQKTFGQATATLAQSLGVLSPLYQMGGPRSMQFALKLVF